MLKWDAKLQLTNSKVTMRQQHLNQITFHLDIWHTLVHFDSV